MSFLNIVFADQATRHVEFHSTVMAHPAMAPLVRDLTARQRRLADAILRAAVRDGEPPAKAAREIAQLGIERPAARAIARTGLSVIVHR